METNRDATPVGPGHHRAPKPVPGVPAASDPGSILFYRDDPVTRYLLNYRPTEQIVSARYWDAIRGFTIEAVADAMPTSPSDAQTLVGPLAQFVAWQWMGGVPLVREELLTWAAVEKFIVTRCKQMTPHGRAFNRSQLRRMVRALGRPDESSVKTTVISTGPSSKPYTAAEEAAFRLMVSNQRTEDRRQNGEVLLALGFGVGLSSSEMAGIRGPHVVAPEGVEVHVQGLRARVVPAFAEWEAVLVAAAERVGDGWLLSPSYNDRGRVMVHSLVRRLQGSNTSLRPIRMRSTWIVRLFDAGIRINVLMAAYRPYGHHDLRQVPAPPGHSAHSGGARLYPRS